MRTGYVSPGLALLCVQRTTMVYPATICWGAPWHGTVPLCRAARLHDACADGSASPENPFLLQRRLVVNAAALLFDICEKAGSEQLSSEIATYLSMAIYKVFRYLYAADPSGVEEAFRTASEHFDCLCNAQMNLSELRIRAAAKGLGGFGLEHEGASALLLSSPPIWHAIFPICPRPC